MKKYIKLITLFMAFVFCLSLAACGAEGKEYTKGLKFTLNEEKTEYAVTAYTGSDTQVVIPEGYKGLPVTAIGDEAFFNCSHVESVTIPQSVTSIGANAFSNCDGLETVALPDGLTAIGEEAFSSCDKLNNLVLPEGIKSVGKGAFWFCTALETVEIPESLTAIEAKAFSSCTSLKKVFIPESVKSIGEEAFFGCSKLAIAYYEGTAEAFGKISVSGNYTGLTVDNLFYHSEEEPAEFGAYWRYVNESPAIWSAVQYVSNGDGTCTLAKAFVGGDFTVPTLSPDGDTVTKIGEKAFMNAISLTSVVIPEGVKTVGKNAFNNCEQLVSLTVSGDVTAFGEKAFLGCINLKNVYISDIGAWCNIKFDGADATPMAYASELYLNGKLVTELVIPDEVDEIKNYAFYSCESVVSVYIHKDVKSIGDYGFSNCSSLKLIEFGGVKRNWDDKVKKGTDWNVGTAKLEITYGVNK